MNYILIMNIFAPNVVALIDI